MMVAIFDPAPATRNTNRITDAIALKRPHAITAIAAALRISLMASRYPVQLSAPLSLLCRTTGFHPMVVGRAWVLRPYCFDKDTRKQEARLIGAEDRAGGWLF